MGARLLSRAADGRCACASLAVFPVGAFDV